MDWHYYLPNELILAGSIIIASIASLMFSGRALALITVFMTYEKKKMIQVTQEIFFADYQFLLGLLGPLTRNESSLSIYIELDTVIHAVMVSTVLRLSVWSYFS